VPPGAEEQEGEEAPLTLSVCRALTGEPLVEVALRATDTVLDLGKLVARKADIEGCPRLLFDGKVLTPADTLRAAGLMSGSQILAMWCPFRCLATASYDKTARLWNSVTGQCEHVLEGHTAYVHCVAFSPDGRSVVTGSHDRQTRVWNVRRGTLEQTFRGHQSYVKAVDYSYDGRFILTGSGDCTAMIWNVAEGVARHWDVDYGSHSRRQWTLQGHMSSLNSVSFAPDGRHCVTGSEDRIVKVWDVETSLCQRSLAGHTNSAYASFAPDGDSILSCSDDTTVQVWDAETGESRIILKGHTSWVRSASWSPDLRFIVSGSGDKTVRIWDPTSGVCVRTLTGHEGFVYSAVFVDDRSVLTASGDNTARLWDVASGECEQVFQGHGRQVAWAAAGPVGAHLRDPPLG